MRAELSRLKRDVGLTPSALSRPRRTMKRQRRELLEHAQTAPRVGVGSWISKRIGPIL